MLPLSMVESKSFTARVEKIPRRVGVSPPCRTTFAKFLDTEHDKMKEQLREELQSIEFVSTTVDIWTADNKSYLGVTAHCIDPETLKQRKAALACRRFKRRRTHDAIATELDNIHSSYGISHKITATVTDNLTLCEPFRGTNQ